MATEVFSVKVSDELKSKIKTLMDQSDMSGQNFMEQIITTYEMNSAKDLLPSAAGDVAELQAITKRMNDIFIHIIERNVNLMAEKDSIHQQALEEKDQMVALIQERLADTLAQVERLNQEQEHLRNQSQALQTELAESEKRISEQERNYRDLLDSKEALIREYRGKNDTLTGIVQEYSAYKDRNKELTTSIETLKAEIEALKQQIGAQDRTEESLRAEMERMSSQNEVALLKGQMEQERAILALREKHQSRIEELTHEHNERIDAYNQQVRELMNEMERLRAGKQVKPENGKQP